MMKKIYLAGFLFAISFSAFAEEPQVNLSDVKKELRAYHDSGAYERDITAVSHAAQAYLDQYLAKTAPPSQKKLAIVYDIDETLLSNYASMDSNDFGGPLSYVIQSMKKSDAKPIQPMLALYDYAQTKGIAQFFVTGRKEDLRAVTIKNLEKAGYSGWKKLYLEPNEVNYKSAADFKAVVREELIKQGYDIVFSMGDQCSDLEAAPDLPRPTVEISLPKICHNAMGDYEDRAFKLPNPYYLVH
jgi:predicted secreted acid phosphatase